MVVGVAGVVGVVTYRITSISVENVKVEVGLGILEGSTIAYKKSKQVKTKNL